MATKYGPKVELHRHLDLSMRSSTMREIAPTVGIPVSDDQAFQEHFLITEPMQGLDSVLNKFLNAQKLLHSAEVLERITYETIEDAYNEGIKILELRYAPTFIQESCHLSFDKIHQSICQGRQKAEKDFPIAVGLICTVQRILPVSRAKEVVDFAIAHKDAIIGLDLADNEVGHDSRPFAPLFLKAKAEGLGITIHSGEANVPDAPYYVRDAIDHLGADRIGHGVQIHHDLKVMDYVKEKDVVLELCPTSNWLTRAVPSKEQHPFRKFFDYGIKTTINSDDPGVFGIDLTNEYHLLAEFYRFNENEFTRCNDYAAAASFIPLHKKQAVWPRPIATAKAT